LIFNLFEFKQTLPNVIFSPKLHF